MKKKSYFILLIIVFIGFFLRFYQLGQVPVGFHRDEAFFGYEGYSLLRTGHDMFGNFLPIHLQSIIYSPSGYSYASVPFIAFLGLNEFSVRFAAALFGSLTIVLVYFLVNLLFQKQRSLALISALFLAISPWHINLSRTSAENVLVVFFITLGIILYLQWLKGEKFWFLLFSFLAFGVTLLLYQAPRAFLPFFIPLLCFLFYKNPWREKMLLPSAMFFFIVIFPLVLIFTAPQLTERIRMLSIFQNPETQLILDEQIREDNTQNPLLTRVFHNKVINYSITFFENYFSHFSYEFLFLDRGFPDRYRIPQMGLLYFFDFLFILFGALKLFSYNKKIFFFLSGWIVLAPLGAAFTYDDIPNLQRTLLVFPALAIVSAFGATNLWALLHKVKFANIIKIVSILCMIYGFVYYLHQYYIHQINHKPWYRQEGYKELVKEVNVLEKDFNQVIMTDNESAPAIFFLFYSLTEPESIQKQLRENPTDSPGIIPLGKYTFVQYGCPLSLIPTLNPEKKPEITGEKGILYINKGTCKIEDERITTISNIKRSDGSTIFTLQAVK